MKTPELTEEAKELISEEIIGFPLGLGDDDMMDRYNVPPELRRKLTQVEQYKPRDHRMVIIQVVDFDPGYPVFNRYQRRLREGQLLVQARRQIRQYLNKKKAGSDNTERTHPVEERGNIDATGPAVGDEGA